MAHQPATRVDSVSLRLATVVGGVLLVLVARSSLNAQKIQFVDGTSSAGLATGGPAQGVAVTDLNRDGFDDVFFAGGLGSSSLFLNNGDGTFRDATSDSGIEVPGNAVAPVWADFNNDGAVDLFVGIRSGADANRLFLNDGNGGFEDVITDSGIDPEARIGSAAFADFDRDGFLDLFLATRDEGDHLYRNVDGQTFEDVTEGAGVAGVHGSVAMQATWVDFDRDGDLDLFAVHDGIDVNRLYRNDGKLPFVEIAEQVGIDQVGSGNGMGVAWFDSNLDGHDDVYVTRIGTASLYRSRGDGTYDDVAGAVGAAKNGLTWGVVAADFDNDGDEDLFLVNTFSFDEISETFLYRNDGGVFTNVARSASAALKLDSFGVATGDFNADGLIDVVITSTAGDNRLLINASEQTGNWIGVEFRNGSSNRFALGGAVRIVAGGVTQRKSLFAGEGYCSQNSNRIHFGIGTASQIDTLEVLWPEGETEVYPNVAPNKAYVLSKGAVSVAREDFEPESFALSMRSYPNPFRLATHVDFSLDQESKARVEVLDLLGRNLKSLASGRFVAGQHTVTWSGDIDQGGIAPAGVYLIRLVADGRQLTRTVVRTN